MAEFVLYNPKLRVYRDGTVERWFDRNCRWGKKGWSRIEKQVDPSGYIRIETDGRKYCVHRLVAACFLGLDIHDLYQEIDHINHNRSDNRVENLRIVTAQQNQWNRKDPKGYYFDKRKEKYHAYIIKNWKNIFLGLFDTAEEAHQAYLNAKAIHHQIQNLVEPLR